MPKGMRKRLDLIPIQQHQLIGAGVHAVIPGRIHAEALQHIADQRTATEIKRGRG